MWHLKLFAVLVICLLLAVQVRKGYTHGCGWMVAVVELKAEPESQTRSWGRVPLLWVYSIQGVIVLTRCTAVSSPTYLRSICLCHSGPRLPDTGTEFRQEKAEENDSILESGFPQAHWSLLQRWFGVPHEAVQVLPKPGAWEGGKGPGKLGKRESSTRTDLRSKLGWRTAWAEPGSSTEKTRVKGQEGLHTDTTRECCLFLCFSLRLGISQRKEMQQRWLWALRDFCLQYHFFFSLRKRRCSLSVAQEWCKYQGERTALTCDNAPFYGILVNCIWLETLKWSNLVFLKTDVCFKSVSISSYNVHM